MAERESFPLRISPELYQAIEKWAADEPRSVNAAGAVWLERSVGSRPLRRAWAASAVAVTLLLVPILLPVLPADVIARSPSLQTSVSQQMFGWPDLAREVATAYSGLPASDRREAMVLAAHDSEAGAIDLYGPALGLPPVVSPHLTYYYWAPARMDPRVVIAVGYRQADLEALFADVGQVGTISNAYGIANNDAGTPIFVCRSPRPAPVAGVAVAEDAGLSRDSPCERTVVIGLASDW